MSQILAPFQLLELNVISAQDLAPLGRNMRTYAVAWVHPDRKLSTRVDTQGHTNPTWNDKFVFRVDEQFLYSDTSAIMVEIYALHWFKDIHVGTVRVLVGNLIPPTAMPNHNDRAPPGLRFVALQVRRPSGRPQGILNVGVAVLDSSMRSMPLYTLNASAVGYRHLMGEKDAYNNHNHMSPHVLAANANANATPGRMGGPKPELRRTKSDTSSVLATDAVLRHQRAIINDGRPSSVQSAGSYISESPESQVSHHSNKKNSKKNKKKKKKGGKRSFLSASVVSDADSAQFTSSILSETMVMPWQIRHGKITTDDTASDVQVSLPPPPPPEDNHNHNHNHNHSHSHSHNHIEYEYENENEMEEPVEVENDNENQNEGNSSVNTNSEATTFQNNGNNHVYKVNATPNRQYGASPAMAPPPHYKSSPKPQFKNSPMPEYRNSPMPQFKNSPMPEYKNSPMPHYKSSPRPEFRNSPMPQYMNSPKPEFRNSPMPEFRNSPMPQFKNSPMPEFRNSPMPQFKNSPMPQFRNSPAVGGVQYRNSPAVSKFNPAVGYGGNSHRGTPMHPLAKMNTGFEYATPMRSNLGNMRPMIMTESELGPSPSEVAAAMARKPVIYEGDNSTVGGWSIDEQSVEGLESKLDRWRTDLPPVIDRSEFSSLPTTATKSAKSSRHSRRHTDGDNGLFSCFGKICGVECSIVCGGGDPKGKKKKLGRQTSSADGTSIL